MTAPSVLFTVSKLGNQPKKLIKCHMHRGTSDYNPKIETDCSQYIAFSGFHNVDFSIFLYVSVPTDILVSKIMGDVPIRKAVTSS